MDGLTTGGFPADWLMVVCTMLAAVVAVAALAAVGSIRRSLNESLARQAQQNLRLAETVAALNARQQAAQDRIQQLTDANRKLGEELAALGERLGDTDSAPRTTSTARLLH
ncbi:hypothetical protein [Azospirillum sp. sgz302134]